MQFTAKTGQKIIVMPRDVAMDKDKPQTLKVSLVSTVNVRLRMLKAGLLILFALVLLRLAQIQIVSTEKYRIIAQKQYQAKIVLPATRGFIFDRNRNVLASNAMYVSFAADPELAAEDMNAIAAKFAGVFGKPRKHYLDKLNSDSRFVWLERQVSAELASKIDPSRLRGLVVRKEPKRLYHNDQVAGQLIGATNVDNKGLAGIELEFDQELSGSNGYVILQRDGLGRARASVDYPRVEPVSGHSIVLTIDKQLQEIAEKALEKGVQQNEADHGIVVMMQPKTGEVLAIGQYPTIDPNRFAQYDPEDQRLRAVTDAFEPGSVFKVVTASAALEHHLITADQKFFAENGTYLVQVPGSKPRPINDTHEYGWITFQEAMEVSSNIVMAKASDVVGSERFYTMARNFGFGIATNIEYPGELKGTLKKPNEWSRLTLNTMAYGYEVQATPIQITAAYCAVANNGVLVKPTLFKQEISAVNETLRVGNSERIRKVISEQTSRQLDAFFEGVVERGTGKPTSIPGVKIAGKTGTSRKYVDGRYEPGSHTASFVGYFPAEDPRIVCLVMIDNPRGVEYYGGTTCAPVFRSIAEQVMTTSVLFAQTARISTTSNPKPRPPASPLSMNRGLSAGVPFISNVVPDVRGLSVRRALHILRQGRFNPVVNGSGTVINQIPAAGQPAKTGMKVTLQCQPRSFTMLSDD